MSNSSQSSSNSMSSSDSDCSEESFCYLTANSGNSEPEFSPFDDTVEPLASAEELSLLLVKFTLLLVKFYTRIWSFFGNFCCFAWCFITLQRLIH